MKIFLALTVLCLASVVSAQNCETTRAPGAARVAREKLGSTDYSYNGWHDVYAPWFTRKDSWFISEVLREAEVNGGWLEKGLIFKHYVPTPIEHYLSWWVASAGSMEGWYYDQVDCEMPCIGDIMAGTVDGEDDSEVTAGIVSSTNPRQVVHLDHDTYTIVEDMWGFELFANRTKREHFVCWRYQIHNF